MRFYFFVINELLAGKKKKKINVLSFLIKLDYFYVIPKKFLHSHFSVFIQVLMLIRPADARICSVVFEPAAALANDP